MRLCFIKPQLVIGVEFRHSDMLTAMSATMLMAPLLVLGNMSRLESTEYLSCWFPMYASSLSV